jgi:hypothetical protein
VAITAAGRRLTQMHRRQQLALRAKVIRDVVQLWPAWQPKDPSSYRAFEDAMVLLAQSRSQQSAAIAAAYLEQYRRVELKAVAPKEVAASVELTFVALAKARSEEQIRTVVGASARGGVYRALTSGQPFEVAMRTGAVRVSGDVSRLVLLGGSDTITGEARRSKLRYARVTSGNPCAFCAMLASRGPVYWSEETASFEPHGHCSCVPEIEYGEGYEWPGHAREFQELWRETGSLNGFRSELLHRQAEMPWSKPLPDA